MNRDARIPVLFDPGSAAAGDAWLVEGDRPAPPGAHIVRFMPPPHAPGHTVGCACCTPRGPVADALAGLFRARATGTAPFFARVIVLASPDGQKIVERALAEDVILRARYSLAGVSIQD